MKQFVCLFVFFTVFHAGSAIKCYNCQSNATNDCKDYSKIPTIECTPVKDLFAPVCIRRVLKSESGVSITLQCINRQTGKECDPPSVFYNVTECNLCMENLCNSNSHSEPNLNLVTALVLSLVIFVMKWL